MSFEGGFTSAINSQSTRDSQEVQRQAVLQEMAQAGELFKEKQAEQKEQRALAPKVLELFAEMQLPPPPQAGAQPPPPGAASVPMTPPAPRPPQAMGQLPPPPGPGFATPQPAAAAPAPQAAPGSPQMGPGGAAAPGGAPQGWQPLPKPPGAPGAAPGGTPGAIGAPPAPPAEDDYTGGKGFLPPAMASPQKFIESMKKANVPPEQRYKMLQMVMPLIEKQNKQLLDEAGLELKIAKAMIAAKDETLKEWKAQRGAAETARHHGALEAQGDRKLAQGQQKININVGGGENDLAKDPETRRFMAEQYWAGDKSVLQNLGRGAQGSKNIVALRKEIVQVGKESGKSPKDLAASMAEFQGMAAGERTLGTRTANIEMAGTEADMLADLALKASGEWKRSGIKTLNDLEKFAQGKTSSPELRAFVAANTSFINAYARAINPQGVGTVADKEHAREMLEVGFSKGDYQAAIEQLKKEIGVAKQAPGKVKESMRAGFTGKGGDAPTIPAGWSVKEH